MVFRIFRRLFSNSQHNKNSFNFIKSDKKNNNNDNNDKFFINATVLGITSYSLYKMFSLENKNQIEQITIHELKKNGGNLEKITIIDEKTALIKQKYTNKYYRTNIPNIDYLEKHLDIDVPINFENTIEVSKFLGPLLSLGFLGTMFYIMSKNSGGLKQIMELTNSDKVVKNVGIKFKDVVGQRNAKRSVSEFVDIINNKDKYNKLGVKVPKGALLSGPPGTGKTLLAKAIAGESGLPFINMSGSDFNAMFVGVGSAKIKNLYKMANKCAEEDGGCIVFIDEIDAIGQKRNSVNTFGGNSERENTLNQLLTEMDGFNENKNIMTFAATNRPELLDPALLRAGRFDRKILVDLPTINDRKDLFNFYLSKLSIDNNIIDNISNISSKLTPGLSGADISNIVNEAGIISARKNKTTVEQEDVNNAIDYVLLGDKKDKLLLENEKHIVSYHEAGHAYLSYILPNIENPVKVSIIPREKGALGFSQSEVSEENLITKKKIQEYLLVLMAGKASEEVFCSDVTNGASNDIEKATELAKKYIRMFGFNENNKFLSTIDNKNSFKSDFSNYLNDTMDKELILFLNDTYDQALNIIIKNKDNIESLKQVLFKKENIYLEDIENAVSKNKIFIP